MRRRGCPSSARIYSLILRAIPPVIGPAHGYIVRAARRRERGAGRYPSVRVALCVADRTQRRDICGRQGGSKFTLDAKDLWLKLTVDVVAAPGGMNQYATAVQMVC